MSIEKSGQHQIKSNQWISKNNNNNNKTLSLKDLMKTTIQRFLYVDTMKICITTPL